MKKYLSLLITLAMVLATVMTLSFPVSAAWEDSITASQPPMDEANEYYLISTAEHFMWLKDNNTVKAKVVADLTIGESGNPFTTPFPFNGTLVGDKADGTRKITAYIETTGNVKTGLFSEGTNVLLQNLSLYGSINGKDKTNNGVAYATAGFIGYVQFNKDLPNASGAYYLQNLTNYATISGYGFVGGIGGMSFSSRHYWTNCKNYGNVNASNQCAGGILGGLQNNGVINCANFGTIYAVNTAGGIVGRYIQGHFYSNYNCGSVTAMGSAGGIIGDFGANKTRLKIARCYNAGNVTVNRSNADGKSAGGIVGVPPYSTDTQAGPEIVNCYNIGTIKANNGNSYPLVGTCTASTFEFNKFTITNSYYLTGTAANANTTGATAFANASEIDLSQWTENATQINSSYPVSDWNMDSEIYDYPQLTRNPHVIPQLGTEAAPYLVTNAAGFDAIRNEPSAYYKLLKDITLPDDYVPFAFTGTLTADTQKTITVNINMPGATNVGLFSTTGGRADEVYTVINNIRIAGNVVASSKYMDGGHWAGGLAGTLLNYSRINNVVNDANVTADFSAGGIAGNINTYVELDNIVNNGTIKTFRYQAGGIAGAGTCNFKKCVNNGEIQCGTQDAGGIVGLARSRNVTQCYNTATVKAERWAGGIVGRADRGFTGVSYSYNNGYIIAEEHEEVGDLAIGRSVAGGIIGAVVREDNYLTVPNVSVSNVYNTGYIYSTDTPLNAFIGDSADFITSTKTYTRNTAYATIGDNAYNLNPNPSGANELDFEGMENATFAGSTFTSTTTDYPFMQLSTMAANNNYYEYYVVSMSKTGNGTVTDEGKTFYLDNVHEYQIRAAADEDYRIDDIKVNNVQLVALPEEDNLPVLSIDDDAAVVVNFGLIPVPTASEISDAFKDTTVAFVVPEISEYSVIDYDDGTFAIINPNVTYGVAISSFMNFHKWNIVDYGVVIGGTNYSAAPYDLESRFGVMFYGNAVKEGSSLTAKPYVTYEDQEGQSVTVYGTASTTVLEKTLGE